MRELSETSINRDYRKIMILISIIAAIILPVILLVGFIFDFIFYLVLFYITVLVSIIGYVGGIWLWEYLATSELIKGDRKQMFKFVGIFALVGFVAFISFNVYIAFYGDVNFIQMIVTNANYLLLFMFCYFIGYLVSIWKVSSLNELKPNSGSRKKRNLDWIIVKKVLKIMIPICVISGGILLGIGLVQGAFLDYLVHYGIVLLLLFGSCLGYLVWERLKKSNLISGEFQKQLKLVSILATIALGGLTFYGFWITLVTPLAIQLFRDLILYYSIFLICMFFYFLGLYVSIVRSK